MKRVMLALVVANLIEYFAFEVHRTHPLVRPGYFPTLLLAIQMSMCWAGIEAARWLLRLSPVARFKGVESDWARLWIWLGFPGGALFALSCYAGKLAAALSDSRLAGPLVVLHFSGGALAWLIASFWALPEALTDSDLSRFEKLLIGLGVASHAAGFVAYFKVYPAGLLPKAIVGGSPLVLLLVSGLAFFFLLYYVGAACTFWALLFRLKARPRS